ncbi:DinB family protein [Polaribacter sargassicola]|uniref:DinB family protein n=1 Tax=Polaribacter sargassicola TaxID=2836891 RepID=UPI001F39017C|nr:DinB family protein [Polaribacter sp. DS7-9]MCG1036418.1 DinB family protein [Polaribacter sp. DS7-9]
MIKRELNDNEYNEYYARYINKVSANTNLEIGYKEDEKMIIDFFSSITDEKLAYKYLPEKWTIKEVFQHIIDTERIFMHRFLRISRKDKTPLPGYDQDIYIDPSEANTKSIEELLKEFSITRSYSKNLINSISKENLKNMGFVSNSPMSARACAFLLLGHSIWHINIIKERYL